jgi:hypothetical protein
MTKFFIPLWALKATEFFALTGRRCILSLTRTFYRIFLATIPPNYWQKYRRMFYFSACLESSFKSLTRMTCRNLDYPAVLGISLM